MDAVNYGKLRVVMLIASVALGCEKAETLSGIEPVYNATTGQILNIQGDEASVNGLNDLACVPMIGVNARCGGRSRDHRRLYLFPFSCRRGQITLLKKPL